MKTLDLNQLNVETFDTVDADLVDVSPIISTDEVPVCDGFTAQHC